MSSLLALLHIWKLFFSFVFLGAIAGGLLWWWLGWMWAIGLLVVFAWAQWEWWHDIKQKLLGSLAQQLEIEYVETNPETVAIDRQQLDQFTVEHEQLGFQHIKDIRVSDESGGTDQDFARLLFQPEYHCFAEVVAIPVPNQTERSLFCSIHSSFNHEWTLSTIQHQPDGLSYMYRGARELWTVYPRASVADLLMQHLNRRRRMVDDLDLEVRPITWEAYIHANRKVAIARHQRFRYKPIFIALVEATLYELNPPLEWLGDYKPS
jgi:hypothetical protein